MMRRGYSLIELLALMGIFVLVFALSARPVWIMVRETPHLTDMYDVQQQIDLFLDQLEEDVETAKRMDVQPAESPTGERTLILDGPAGSITYSIQTGRVRRTGPGADESRSWALPYAELDWQPYEPDGSAVGVEIRTAINRPLLGKQELKFQQSRLFLVGLREETL